MTGKLAKAFRKCTRYELTYCKDNHALFSIRIFSPPDKKIDDDAVWTEVKNMASAVKAKFDGKISCWSETNYSTIKTCRAGLNIHAFQTLEIRAYKADIDKANTLYCAPDARQEKGWIFSINIVDRGIQSFLPQRPKPSEQSTDGVDAL